MTKKKSTKSQKVIKPYTEFPFTPAHAANQWVKKIKGKTYAFGRLNDPWEDALAKYESEVHDLQRGDDRIRQGNGEISLEKGINLYLSVMEESAEHGDISTRHFDDAKRTCLIVVDVISKRIKINDLKPDHFRKLRRRFETKQDGGRAATATFKGHAARTRALFNWLYEEGEIDTPVRFGTNFAKLSKQQQTQQKVAADQKQFTPDEIRTLINGTTGHSYRLKAMILLGINCAFGDTDIAELRFTDIDLDAGWIDNRRKKTGEKRCCKLWPETEAALRTVYARRFNPDESEYDDRVFITKNRRPSTDQWAVSQIFGKHKTKVGINGTGRGFYCLRHTFRDIANRAGDDHACDWVLGHKIKKTGDHYIHNAPRDRIEKLTDYVRRNVLNLEDK